MLYEQVMEPRYASCETSAGPFEKTFMDNHSIFINLKTDDQFNLLSNVVLEPIAGVQKRNEHSAQGMTMVNVPTTSQLADIMTKGVKADQWEMCVSGLLGQPLIPSNKTVMAQEGEN